MTHTNHRTGARESLERDYVVIMRAHKGINDQDTGPKARGFLDLAWKRGAVNMGDGARGSVHLLGYEGLRDGMDGRLVAQAVFRDPVSVAAFLADLREEDFGMSVTVAGLFDITQQCCRETGLRPHAYEHSAGVWGRVDKMPEETHLDVMTMCGHGFVPAALVDRLVEEVRVGSLTPEEAGLRLARQCVCGVFNPERAAEIVAAMAGR